MDKLLLSMAISVMMSVALWGQTRISGVVKDASTEKEVYNLSVILVETGEEVKTDRIGYFQFVDVETGTYTVRVSGVGYLTHEQEVVVSNEPRIDLGEMKIVFNPKNEEIGIITLTSDELSADESSSQSAAGLLQSSQDVFASTAAFELGAYWFKVRGYDNKYNDVFFNGVRMNKINNDRVNFGDWGGLNDVTRRPAEQTLGIEPSQYVFGDVGGVTYFDTRPSMMRKGTSLAYSFTNRSYNQRVLATYNTGLMDNGWAFMASGARRWAEEGVIDGTFYDSWAYFFAAEKKFNDRHSIVLSGFGSPTRRSTNSPNTQEVYDLMGKDYNAYWGWQDGEKRSERIRQFHQPLFMLTHHFNISNRTNLITTLGYQFGKDSRSRLDWHTANNPSPTYYRNLPSYYAQLDDANPENVAEITRLWQTDQTVSQIDWTDIYNQNRNRTGAAAYVLAADVNEDQIMTFSTRLQSQIMSNFKLTAGLNYQNTRSEYYREVLDLLGGNYFVNNNAFQDTRYNMDEDENRQVMEGDKYQYNYIINHQRGDAFIQGEYTSTKFDVTLGMKAAYTSVNRDGKYRHEQYLDRSAGKSETYDFVDWGSKLQVLYKLNGRNFFQLNAMYASYAPTVDEIFPNARSNDYTIDNYVAVKRNGAVETLENGNNLKNSKILSTDLSYILRAPRVKGRLTGFYTRFFDEYEKNFGYIDVTDGSGGQENLFGAEYLYNVDKLFFGGEFALEAQLTTTLTLSAVASVGQYTYDNNPTYQRFSDSNFIDGDEGTAGQMVTFGSTSPETAYMENYRLAVGPQQGFSLGLEYRAPQYWWIGATGNYLAANYLDIAPFKRTSSFLTYETASGTQPYPQSSDEALVRSLLEQQELSSEFMLNLNAGKTFRFGKYYMGISANVNNVLDNRDYVTGGFEQIRLGNLPEAMDEGNQSMFGPKYWYDRGRSYFINVFFRF
ncbi:TonB-dependent receptor [Moheibacter lacus]|uniref:TonB-dependent receptor n=1 Tax=Moheibacter lacus TaxID=2745851 RepID=A0A838ZHI2_9FLAO|nr:TonB-dependent receptor [Moheibacter lacus]MBA5629131.1 TonB-dependent receptor [Moheibacter lacus]